MHIKKETKTRIYILLLAFWGAISCVFIYKPNLLTGQILVKEVETASNNLMEPYMTDSGQMILPSDMALIYEDNVNNDYNKITFCMHKSISDFEPYRVRVCFVNKIGETQMLEQSVSEENDSVSVFSSLINAADVIQIYILGNKGQKINLEKIQLLYHGFHSNAGLSAGIGVFILGLVFYILINLTRKYAREYLRVKTLFYYLMAVGIGIYLLEGVLSQGVATMSTLMLADTHDTFMDFVNSIQYGTRVYEKNVIYPPLVNCIYALFGRFIPQELWDTTKIAAHYEVRGSQYGRVLIAVYIVLTTTFFAALIRELKKGKLIEKYAFLIISVFTVPFLFTLERGNIIIVAMCFVLIFIYWHDSDRLVYRHIAMISLAIAVSIKIYPVIFGILLVQKKRWKDVAWCLFYGITIFFLPIVFLGGFKNVPVMIDNIINASALMSSMGYGCFVDLKHVVSAWGGLLKIGTSYVEIIYGLGLIICVVGAVVLMLFGDYKDKWKKAAICCLLMILLPSFSSTYTLIYLLCPLMMFIDKDSNSNKMDYIYLALFVLTIIPFGNFAFFYTSDKYLLNTATLIEGMSCVLMLFFLYLEGTIGLVKGIRSKIYKDRIASDESPSQ